MENSVKIILDSESGTNSYYAGQTVSGKVQCTFTTDEIIRAIKINYRGSAKTDWMGIVGKGRMPFWAEEVYFDEMHNLVEDNEENQFRLLAGTYTYSFSYKLPQEIPTSFSDHCGTIQYKIKVIVDRPRTSNYEVEQLLFVISPLDLNLFPVKEPFLKSAEETITCCCYSAGEIIFTVSLPITGYAADQHINIGSYVQNMSNVSITSAEYKIIRTIEYSAQNPWKNKNYFKYTLANCSAGAIGAHAQKSWTTSMKIPVEDVLNLLSCNIINASDHLEAKVILPYPYMPLKITCPITLGTIPLTGIDTSLPGPPLHSNPSTTSPLSRIIVISQNDEENMPLGESLQSYRVSIDRSSNRSGNELNRLTT